MADRAEEDAIARVLIDWLSKHGYPLPAAEARSVPIEWLRDVLVKIHGDNPAADLRSREARRWVEALATVAKCLDAYEARASKVTGESDG